MGAADPLSFHADSSHIPGHAIAVRALNAANRLSKSWAMSRMKAEGLLEVLGGRPETAFQIEADDLWFLYTQVRHRKPRVVLEFGSGYSTSILAEAVRRNRNGTVVSIEAFAEWAEVTNTALAKSGLSRVANVYHIPAVPTQAFGKQAWKHESLPPGVTQPDFIYLDGPPLHVDRPFSVDLLDLEERGPLKYVVVDGRKANFAFLKIHLRHSYRFTWRRIHYNGTIESLAR